VCENCFSFSVRPSTIFAAHTVSFSSLIDCNHSSLEGLIKAVDFKHRIKFGAMTRLPGAEEVF